MKSKISDNLKFTGRLSMYKNWGDSTIRNNNFDSMQGRRPDSSAIYAERAYLDWILNPEASVPIILTLGRQPASDGPSYQIKENTTRKGTYDALSFDGAADGLVLTANLNKISEGTSVRVAYGTPNVLDNEQYSSQQMSYTGKDKSSFKNTKVTGIFVDQEFRSLPFENLTQAYYVSATNLNANPQLLDINSSSLGSSSFMQSQDINIGDLDLSGIMFEAQKVGGVVDLFAHYARSSAKSNGKVANLGAMGNHGLLTSQIPDGSIDNSVKTGNAIWVGARFHINQDWKIGAEYNKGSENWFNFTSGSNDPLNKLATRGTATEIYANYSINKNANIRAGVVNIDYDYDGAAETALKAAGFEDKLTDWYLFVQAKF
jgi:hypothetical protein